MNEIKDDLSNNYQYLMPNFNELGKIKEIWKEYNKAGISSPDIDNIMATFPKINESFFQEIVQIASRVSSKDLNIEYCPFILNDYNLAARSAADGYLIIIDEYLLSMLYDLSYILTFKKYKYIQKKENKQYKDIIITILTDYLDNNIKNRNLISELYTKDYETAEFAVYLYNSFKVFMFAHEISHHILKHTEGTYFKECCMNNRSCNIEIDKTSFDQEFEADAYGYKIFLEVLNTADNSINYAYCKYRYEYAPLFLLDIFDKIDRIKEKILNYKIKYITHPSPMERRKKLSNQYNINNPNILYYKDTLYNYNIMKRVLQKMIINW